jgi:MIP family channel proteins
VEQRGSEAYVAEFIGTFFLVLFITGILSVSNGLGYADFAVIGLVHVFVLSMLIHSLGDTSGAHFNPAVTIALAAMRKIRGADAGAYIVMQLAGGLSGALVTRLILLDEGKAGNYGATTISKTFLQGDALPGLVVEALGTFVLMWAIMGLAVNPQAVKGWAGWVIGGTLGMAVMVFGPLTGAGFNPARTFGPAVAGGEWSDFWVYVIGPVAGALLAAFVYSAIVLGPPARVAQRPVDKLP